MLRHAHCPPSSEANFAHHERRIAVQFTRELESFVQQRVGSYGLYDSASEHIRELVHRDYEQEDRHRWVLLENELDPGMKAEKSEFVPLEAESIPAKEYIKKVEVEDFPVFILNNDKGETSSRKWVRGVR